MPPALINQGTQIGVESLAAPGVAVQATRILSALSFVMTPNPQVDFFRPEGSQIATTKTPIKDGTNVKVDGRPSYNELQYPLSSVLCDPVITTPSGATLTRLWTYALNINAPNVARTLSVERGNDLDGAKHYNSVQLTDLTMSFTRNAAPTLSGSGFGQPFINDRVRWITIVGSAGTFTVSVNGTPSAAIAYNASAATLDAAIEAISGVGAGKILVTGGPGGSASTPYRVVIDKSITITSFTVNGASLTGTGAGASVNRMSPSATRSPVQTISPTEIDVFAASSFAGLDGATAMPLGFKWDWGITGRYSPYYPMNTSYGTGYAGTNETIPKSSIGFDIGADALMNTYINSVTEQTVLYIRLRARGPLIETGFYQELKVDTAFGLATISEDKDVSTGGLLGKTFTGEWMADPTTGRGSIVTLQNTLTAL